MRVLYFYDALCGWCFGNCSVMKDLHREFGVSLEFEVISAGMVLGSNTSRQNKIAKYIGEAYKRVEYKTGATFGDAFVQGALREGNIIFDSFPPSKALRIFKEFRPYSSLYFASEIQRALYYEGRDLNELTLYLELIRPFNIAESDFKILWNSSDYDVRTREEFLLAQQLNVSAYPTVFFETGSKFHQIAQGYTEYPVLASRLRHVMKSAEAY